MNRTIRLALSTDLALAAVMAASVFLSVTGVSIAFATAILLFLFGLAFGVIALGNSDVPKGWQAFGLIAPFLSFIPVVLLLLFVSISPDQPPE